MLCAGQSQDCPDPCFAHEQSQDCAANPWFVPQTMDPGFAQDNPGIAQIHALRVTSICNNMTKCDQYMYKEYKIYVLVCMVVQLILD